MGPARFARPLAWCLALLALDVSAADGVAAPYRPVPGADGVQRIEIVGGSYFFRPSRIVVKAGKPVELSIRTESGVIPHRFVLEAPDGRRIADVSLGDAPQKLTFILASAGRYPFYCPNQLLFFKSHRERGMAGELDVEE